MKEGWHTQRFRNLLASAMLLSGAAATRETRIVIRKDVICIVFQVCRSG